MSFHNHEISIKDTEHHPIPKSIRAKMKLQILQGVSAKQIHKELSDWSRAADGGSRRNRLISLRSVVTMKNRILKSQGGQVKMEHNEQSNLPTDLRLVLSSSLEMPTGTM
jgi:hypothetical protein